MRNNRSFESLTAYFAFFGYFSYTLTGSGEPERLVGVQVDGRVGVAQLIGVLVRGVVGAQIFDAAEMGFDDAQAAGGTLVDQRFGIEPGIAHDNRTALAEAIETDLGQARRDG